MTKKNEKELWKEITQTMQILLSGNFGDALDQYMTMRKLRDLLNEYIETDSKPTKKK